MIALKKSDINYQKPKNWLLPLTGESLLVFCYLKKSDIISWPGCQSTFPPSPFPRSLAFEFLRAGPGTASATTMYTFGHIRNLVYYHW